MLTKDKEAPKEWSHRKLVGWKAWYADGSSYSSAEYKWEDIPQRGFIALNKFLIRIDDEGNEIGEIFNNLMVTHDLYVLNDEVRDNIEHLPKEIKVGEWMEDAQFNELYDKAKFDDVVKVRI